MKINKLNHVHPHILSRIMLVLVLLTSAVLKVSANDENKPTRIKSVTVKVVTLNDETHCNAKLSLYNNGTKIGSRMIKAPINISSIDPNSGEPDIITRAFDIPKDINLRPSQSNRLMLVLEMLCGGKKDGWEMKIVAVGEFSNGKKKILRETDLLPMGLAWGARDNKGDPANPKYFTRRWSLGE